MSLDVTIRRAAYQKKTVLENVSFSASMGEITAVIGRNGSGKSTLISCIASLIPYEGEALLDGERLSDLRARERATRLSAVLQELTRPHVTVEELVSFGRQPYRSLLSPLTEEDWERINRAIKRAGLEELRHAYVDRISGGELRRAYYGAMLAQETPLVLLDEGTAFMDADYRRRFMELGRELAEEGRTVVAVMHELSDAVRYAHRILLLEEGRMRFFGSVEELLGTDLIERSFSVTRHISGNSVFFE